MKIILVADFFVKDGILGGGELNNDELANMLTSQGAEVKKMNSNIVTTVFINENIESKFVIANFLRLHKDCKSLLMEKADYVIYEKLSLYTEWAQLIGETGPNEDESLGGGIIFPGLSYRFKNGRFQIEG